MREIRQLLDSSAFSDLDRHFAAFVETQAGGNRPTLALAAALVSQKRSDGHVCLDLVGVAGAAFPEEGRDDVPQVRLPRLKPWLKNLRDSAVVGSPGEFRPLILDRHDRLYLHRYWHYEQTLAKAIIERAARELDYADDAKLQQRLEALFPPEPGGGINWQRAAALTAVRRRFCVISGGPGTGKTHTLVLILTLLLELERDRNLRIAVAAPTGKAAARIQDSIQAIRENLPCDEGVKGQLPEQATTLHRLLGYVPDSGHFRYNAENLLPCDLIAVDEASMVDLALMAKLFQAIPPAARVILLGDKDQLAAVEAGAVLGDICSAALARNGRGAAPSAKHALADCVVQLQRNYRFGEQSSIYRLSSCIKSGSADEAFQIVDRGQGDSAGDLVTAALPGRAKLKEALRERVLKGYSAFIKASDPREALALLSRFRILCALREGPFGVAGLNQMTEAILEDARLVRLSGPWYLRRPILITRNDYNLKLFNGDIGIILIDRETNEPRAFFPGPDHAVRKFLPLQLPEHETAFALSVHKSQGSEFDSVLLVLPDRESPVVSRELLYTGLTRARKSVELWFDESTFRAAINRPVRRTSGLADALGRPPEAIA